MAYVTPQTWTASQLVTAADLNQDVRDNVAYLYARAHCFVWHVAGNLTTGTSKAWRLRVRGDITFVEAELTVLTAPTDADLIVDINLGGTSLWATTQANRPTIAAAGTAGETTSFDTATATDDDVLTLDIDQIGSSVAGADLAVVLWYR